ncbi:MAG: exosortase [Phycisphaerae bacterium]|nr:exosortase [Phycisphaerae bacterium]
MANPSYSMEQVKAVILIGARDFGRCPTATRLNRALWPVAGKPVVQHLIEGLAAQGLRRFVLCCENSADQVRENIQLPAHLDVRFIEATMPRGTAGCIRDAAEPGRDELLLAFAACTLMPPDVDELIRTHQSGDASMTIFFNAVEPDAKRLHDAQLYMCEPSILDAIPPKGYCDIKEGLVPSLVAADKKIFSARVSCDLGTFVRWPQYLCAASQFLTKLQSAQSPPSGVEPWKAGRDVWVGRDVQIADSVRICGPVLIESGARIASDAIILGPTLIGKGVTIGHNSCVEQAVIWENAKIGRNCHIRQSLIDQERTIPSSVKLDGQLAPKPKNRLVAPFESLRLRLKQPVRRPVEAEDKSRTLADYLRQPVLKWTLITLAALLLGGLIATYWRPTIVQLWHIWLESDEYSCGLLVPFLAAYVLWSRRDRYLDCPVRPAWTGLGLLLAAQAFRLFGLYYMFASAERLALVLSIGGIVLLLFGWRFFGRFAPVFIFLFLMLPLPNRVESRVTLPLQEWATVSAVFSLEALGYSAVRQGNIIQIGETIVAVAEACNGLRMLTAFFVISGFIVLISTRKRWEKAVVLVSTIPIALLCNTIRLTLTSLAFTYLRTEALEELFHDFGGLAMMPLAIGVVVFQLWLLKVLFQKPKRVEHQLVFSRNSSDG